MFGARLWSPGPTPTAEFLIFLCAPPHSTTSTSMPQLWSRWECFIKTWRRGPRRWSATENMASMAKEPAGPEGPWGPHQHRPVVRPRGERGMLFQSGPVGSDGWENTFLRWASEMDEFCLHIRNKLLNVSHDKCLWCLFKLIISPAYTNEFSIELWVIYRK